MDGKWKGFRSFKPGKSGNPPAHRGVARRFKGKMQSEDARVENHPVVRQVYRVGKVATPRGMIRFALGSLEVCEITDEITAGILGAEVTGNSATWLTELKKKISLQEMANLLSVLVRSYLRLTLFFTTPFLPFPLQLS